MDKSHIFGKVAEVVAKYYHINADNIDLETEFIKDLHSDSVDALAILYELELAFNLRLDYSKRFFTVSDSVEMIWSLLQEGNHE